MTWPQLRRICLDLSMATYTPMDYWLELDIPELMEHVRDVEKIIKESGK